MEIKKCSNCGSFTTAENSLCDACAKQLKYNTTILNSYFEENANFGSIKSISSQTGLSPAIIQKYMIDNNYSEAPVDSGNDYFNNIPF